MRNPDASPPDDMQMSAIPRRKRVPVGRAAPRSNFFRIAVDFVVITALASINHFGTTGNLLFVSLAGLMVFLVRHGAVKAFSIAALAPTLNTAFVDDERGIYTAARLALYGLIAVKLVAEIAADTEGNHRAPGGYFAALTAFCAVSGLLALINGYFVGIALLKLVSFFVGALVVGAALAVNRKGNRELDYWFYAMILFITTLGLVAWRTGQGYNAKGEAGEAMGLFNGPFYHPNLMGPMAAMIVLYLSILLVFGGSHSRLLTSGMGVVFLVFLYWSKSRTGMGTLLSGWIVLVSYTLFYQKSTVWCIRPIIKPGTIVLYLIFMVAGAVVCDVLKGGAISNAVTSYVLKNSQSPAGGFETVIANRQERVSECWADFKSNPWIGIGFGTSKSPEFAENATMFSAPTEKGCLPVAVLQEVGLIGTFFFVAFLATFFLWLWREKNLPALLLLFALLVVNLGEDMFFSFGGHGALVWTMVMFGGILGGSYQIAEEKPTPLVMTARSARNKRAEHSVTGDQTRTTTDESMQRST